jgi:hypothetical protein
MKIEQIPTEKLIPYARNAKKHDAAQVSKLAGSIREFGFNNPVLIDKDNGIIAGHGRVMAAQKLELKDVPCIRLGHLTDTQRKAYILTDNRLAELGGGWDEELLKLEIKDIDWGELKEISVDDFNFGEIDFGGEDQAEGKDVENPYTAKVEAPTYTPTGPKPDIAELADQGKCKELKKRIDASGLPEDEKQFLQLAASRHIVFDYQQIAEYYAHSNKEMQALMEESALVIIDFKQAVENGFVKLTDRIAGQFKEDLTDE